MQRMGWCFALVNNKLAEVYFERKKNGKVFFYGHCYVKESDYTTKKKNSGHMKTLKYSNLPIKTENIEVYLLTNCTL